MVVRDDRERSPRTSTWSSIHWRNDSTRMEREGGGFLVDKASAYPEIPLVRCRVAYSHSSWHLP
ncbi:MAG: hypothetical protein QM305_07540 [Bacteroidota bacterium]|nr:hypothetical protein [Bacteroidota bacterium]